MCEDGHRRRRGWESAAESEREPNGEGRARVMSRALHFDFFMQGSAASPFPNGSCFPGLTSIRQSNDHSRVSNIQKSRVKYTQRAQSFSSIPTLFLKFAYSVLSVMHTKGPPGASRAPRSVCSRRTHRYPPSLARKGKATVSLGHGPSSRYTIHHSDPSASDRAPRPLPTSSLVEHVLPLFLLCRLHGDVQFPSR